MNRGTWLALAAIASAEIGMSALVQSVEAQVVRETGVTTVAGVALEYRCAIRPDGASRFYAEGVYRTSDVVSSPFLPSYTVLRPGHRLVAVAAGTDTGSGTASDPIGDFAFRSDWSEYEPRLVRSSEHDTFATADGDIYATHLSHTVEGVPEPGLRRRGAFTFAGGTGRYANASGSVSAVTHQLGDGVSTAFVVCGWIDGITSNP
jgi:hypothetical protein